jgi:hypothetical protein
MYVYLVSDPFSKLIKIGKSKNPLKRLQAIRSSNPFAELFFYSDKYEEKELHERFKHKRVVLEWFNLDKNDLVSITGSYACIPKRLHYNSSKKSEKRLIRITEMNSVFLKKYNYICGSIPDVLFCYDGKIKENMKAYNSRTKRELRQVMKGGSLGFVLNGKFYSTTAIVKNIRAVE